MAPFSFYFCPSPPYPSLAFLPPPLPSLAILSFSRRRVSTKKLTNRPRDAQVRLFIKKFLLRSARAAKHTSVVVWGLRSKNLFALPPPSPPPSLPFGRYCFTILYYTAWYVEFRLFGFNETRPEDRAAPRRAAPRLASPRLASPGLEGSRPRPFGHGSELRVA